MESENFESSDFRYWAFVSYSHQDRRWGEWLIKTIETFKIPKELVGQDGSWGKVPPRLFPLFRDRDELAGAADLGDKIEGALRQSRFLIAICSPHAAASQWVNKENKTCKAMSRGDRVLSLIVAGEPNASANPATASTECFPPALRFGIDGSGELTPELTEPLAADVRKDRDGERNAALKVIAGILGVNFDRLKQRDHERRIRRLQVALATLLLVLGVVAALAVYANVQRLLALERARIATSRQLAAQSQLLLKDSRIDLPLLLAVESHRFSPTLEARRSLFEALTAAPAVAAIRYPRPDGLPAIHALSPQGRHLAGAFKDGKILICDLSSRQITAVEPSANTAEPAAVVFSHDDSLLAVGRVDGTVELCEVATGKALGKNWKPHDSPSSVLAFHPTQPIVAAGSSETGEIVLWNFVDGRQVGNRIAPN
ncbi:MAG: toll/interleukin-1 receptor domain-containing protein, partial [Candidatus Eiseniibacteriota bacterium]